MAEQNKNETPVRPVRRPRPLLGWAVFLGGIVVAVGLGWLAGTINERRAERIQARVQFVRPINEWEPDNAKWGESFPREYNSWKSTEQMAENTKYGGSGYRDYLKSEPNLVVMWAGYAFAKGYSQARGHYHAVEDVTETVRISEKSPATCWTCKSPDVPKLMSEMGPAKFYASKFSDFKGKITHPIGCADCHDNKTMALRISRPALREAFQRHGKNIDNASLQEKRTLVCAQCHVEYYFKGKTANYLTFPWDKGTTADNIEGYYYQDKGEMPHVDYIHAISGARMIKMQHPDYELYSQGVHAFRNVSCADCHMPYTTEGGIKYTDHQIRSPLYNMAASCQVCHRWSEDEIRGRVYSIQDKNREMLTGAATTITAAHIEIGEAMKAGATDQELAQTRDLVSRAQMYWDYIAAANGMGFHAPQESARVLAKATRLGSLSRLENARILARHGKLGPVLMPDLASVEKAQAYIKPFVTAQAAALEKEKAQRAHQAEQDSKVREKALGTKNPL